MTKTTVIDFAKPSDFSPDPPTDVFCAQVGKRGGFGLCPQNFDYSALCTKRHKIWQGLHPMYNEG